jgi:hypothetical protein
MPFTEAVKVLPPLDQSPFTLYFLYMGIIRVLRPALFIYETVRIIILAVTLMFVLPGNNAIPWLAFASPGALFPLMALFLWIDIRRYKPYIPLYIAGKCIGILSLLVFSITSGRFTMINKFYGASVFAELIFLSGDLLALAGILFIFMNRHKFLKKPVLTTVNTSDTEDKQCE